MIVLHTGVVRDGLSSAAFAFPEIRKVGLADEPNFARKGSLRDQDGGLGRRSAPPQRTARSPDIG